MFFKHNFQRGFYFVFDCSAITQIDSSGLNALREVISDIQKKTMAIVYFVNANQQIKELLLAGKVATGEDDFFNSLHDFISLIKAKKSTDMSVVNELQ